MPNKNYEAGRRREYAKVHELRGKGYHIAVRSAGSHSPVDVWAIDIEKKRIKVVQCKKNDSERLRTFLAIPTGVYFLEAEVD